MFFLISTKSRIGAVKKRKFFYNPLGIGKKVQKGESNPWLMIFARSKIGVLKPYFMRKHKDCCFESFCLSFRPSHFLYFSAFFCGPGFFTSPYLLHINNQCSQGFSLSFGRSFQLAVVQKRCETMQQKSSVRVEQKLQFILFYLFEMCGNRCQHRFGIRRFQRIKIGLVFCF